MKGLVIAVAMVCLASVGCEKSSDPVGDVRSIELSVGSAWTYRWHVEQYASDGTLVWDTTSQFIVVVSAINQTVGMYAGLTLLEARDQTTPTSTSEIWYAQSGERLTEVAYRSPGNTPIVLPKRSGVVPAHLPERLALSPFVRPFALGLIDAQASPSDSLQIRQDPRVVYVYPLSEGTAWVSFTSPFLQERVVEGYDDLPGPGGTYHSARIRTTIPTLAPGLQWIDHVSAQGLVRRRFDSWVSVMDPSGTPEADSLHILESIDLLAH